MSLTDEIKNEIIKDYLSGSALISIVRRYKTSVDNINEIILDSGNTLRTKDPTATYDLEAIKKDIEEHKISFKEIADKHNVYISIISSISRKMKSESRSMSREKRNMWLEEMIAKGF